MVGIFVSYDMFMMKLQSGQKLELAECGSWCGLDSNFVKLVSRRKQRNRKAERRYAKHMIYKSLRIDIVSIAKTCKNNALRSNP